MRVLQDMNQESTEMKYTFKLPMPPSLNDYYGHSSPSAHRVIKYVKTKGKEYRINTKKYILSNNLNIQANVPLKMEILLIFNTNRKQDIDNRLKCLLDALTYSEVYEDDSLIYDLHIVKQIIKSSNQEVIITLQEYPL